MARAFICGPISTHTAESFSGFIRSGQGVPFTLGGDKGLRLQPSDTWQTFTSRFPDGFTADFVLVDMAGPSLPFWFWSIPIPIIALASDWDLHWHRYRLLLPRCDLVISDRKGAAALTAAGIKHARSLPAFGQESAAEETAVADGIRDIDILSVGSLHPTICRPHLPFASPLARLGRRCNVVVQPGLAAPQQRPLL
jgi:hypothetical protein